MITQDASRRPCTLTWHRRWLPLLAASLAVACSAEADKTPTPIPLAELPRTMSGAMCDLIDRCDGWLGNTTFSTQERCLAVSKDMTGLGAAEVAQVGAGTLQYDGLKAAQCLAAINALSCGFSGHTAVNTGCAGVFVANLDDGEVCKSYEHCKSGRCKGANQPLEGCPGTCAAGKQAGESCAGDMGACVDGLPCDNGICLQHVGGTAKLGESCKGDFDCAGDLSCSDNGQGGGGACRPYPTLGEACVSEPCADAFVCIDGTCRDYVQAGGTCTPAEPGWFSPCARGLRCDGVRNGEVVQAGKCVPYKKAGAPCKASVECKGDDQYCKTGKCAQLPSNGEACLPKDDAWTPRCNVKESCLDDNTCKAKAAPPARTQGQKCWVGDAAGQCGQDLVCAQGTCVAASESLCGG